ncbi:hypothetical protein A7K94_0208965 [Modestobacter sp. VKM Ac-2676]|nr:hypothetical protein A7K94_0208965 [Modestobacter sp. VKM Ac-2676]
MTTVPNLVIAGLHNLRDVGGISVPGGSTVRRDRLFRSAAPMRPGPSFVADVTALGICRVVDLRDEGEQRLTPHLWEESGVTVHRVPVFGNRLHELRFADLAELYRIMLAGHGAALGQAFRTLTAGGPQPTLVHCTAGKDRTGLLVALALEVLGADRADVLADYVVSQTMLGAAYLDDLAAIAGRGPLPGAHAHRATASPAELLEESLAHLDQQYGGALAYLTAHGVTDDDVAAWRAAMLQPSAAATR